MKANGELLASVAFKGEIIEWRGPAPYVFIPVPDDQAGELRYAARLASYGWGVVPVEARVNDVPFSTSLFPKDGTYLLPIKVAVQKAASIAVGNTASVMIEVHDRC